MVDWLDWTGPLISRLNFHIGGHLDQINPIDLFRFLRHLDHKIKFFWW